MVEYLKKDPNDFYKRSARLENVFIVGAGFSKAFGLPLTTELIDECVSFCTNPVYRSFSQERSWMSEYPSHLKRVSNWFYGPNVEKKSIEDLLSDIQSYRKLAELTELPQGPNEEILDLFKYTCRLISIYLNQRTKEIVFNSQGKTGPIQQLLQQVKTRSTFVSINYDLLLEMQGMGEAYDIEYENLIKLHGSTDLWLLSSPFPELPNIGRVFTNQDVPGIEALADRNLVRIEYHSGRASTSDIRSHDGYPLLIPPVQSKDFEVCRPYFKQLTERALHALTFAKKIFLIGCRLNPIDKHFLSIIRLATYRRASEPSLQSQIPDWHVFDLSDEPQRILKSEFGIEAKIHRGSWTENLEALLELAQ